MPTGTADPRRVRPRLASALAGGLVAAAVAGSLSACSDDLPPPTYSTATYDDVARLMQGTLDQRAAALEREDAGRFRATLDRRDADLLRQQIDYYDNISDLPVGLLRYRVLPDTVSPVDDSGDTAGGAYGSAGLAGREYWAEVVLALQLDGFDSAPVRTRDRFLFRTTDDGERLVVASTSDPAWEDEHPGNTQPWDRERIEVRQADGVLGIFDDLTVDDAPAVLREAAEGRREVRSVIGGDSAGAGGTGGSGAEELDGVDGVIVYAVDDASTLRGLAGQSVGDPDRADGLTVAVPVDTARPGRGTASYRVFLNTRVLSEPDDVLGRLVRHELTHALLGPRARKAPLWLNEGLAEYTSVQALPERDRRLPSMALTIAGTATDLPRSADFAGPDAESWYGVAWWVCEYIARTYGQRTLLVLLDSLGGGADEGEVLRDALGLDARELVRRGADLMAATYRG
ncbi:hypothetical protein [Nocardioides sp.]|uniref:hypothetical protein n=1 Tax=Nocardioides sp. TaxID=35761 RepID=UPI003517D1D6